jgi:predicted TIM-barrel fold metal-dependent hydrolase
MRLAVDAHAHVFDLERYPFHPTSGFDLLPNEPGNPRQYTAVLDAHGISHALLINPLGGYGVDNRGMLDAIAASDGRFKGVAVVPHDIAESALEGMIAGGIVGIRFNLSFPSSPSPHGAGGARLMALCAARGLCLQIHYHEGAHMVEALPLFDARRNTLVFDHCGRPDIATGLQQPGFLALLEAGRRGSTFVKLSALFRFSKTGWPYHDADPFVARLIDAFTIDRCLWGSDWPFLRARARIDYGPELAVLQRWFPDAADRRKVLWDTPARLFGFGGPHQA